MMTTEYPKPAGDNKPRATLAPPKGPTSNKKKKNYRADKPLPLPASSRGSVDDDTFVHEFSRTDVRELIHSITQELKLKGNKTPLVLLAFRPKIDDEKLTTFLSQVFPNGTTPAPLNQVERSVKDTDEYTLMAALKYLWARLPMDSIIGWDAYESFKKLETKSDYPKKAFLEFMPQCLTSPAHASIVYDFLDLLVSLSANAKENQLSGRKISKMAGLWAFHGPPNSANLTKSRLDPTDNSFKEGLKDWLPAADALFHLFLSFLRSMLPDDQNTKLQLPRTLQALLASNSYPPPDLTFSSSTLVSVPLVTIKSSSLSNSPIELLNKIPKVLRFDNPNDFEAKEDYALLKSLCRNDGNIMSKLSGESRRIIGLMCKKPTEGTLTAGWPEYHPPQNIIENKTEVSISRVSIDDYFIWTWMSSMSFEEPSSKKKLFGRSLISEFVFDGFKKWIIVEEQNIESVRNHRPPIPEKPKTQQRVPSAQPHYKSLILDEPTSRAKSKPKPKVLQEQPVPNNIPPPTRKTSIPMSPKLGLLKPFKKFQNHHDKPLPDATPEPNNHQFDKEMEYEPPEDVGKLPEIETNQYRLSMPLDSFGFDDDYDPQPSSNQYQNIYSTGEYQSTAPPRQNDFVQPIYYDHDNRYDNNNGNGAQMPYFDPTSRDAFVNNTSRHDSPPKANAPLNSNPNFGIYQAPSSPHKSNDNLGANNYNGSIEDLTYMVNKLSHQVNEVETKLGGGQPTNVTYLEEPTQQVPYQDHHARDSTVTATSQTSSGSKPKRKPPQGNSGYAAAAAAPPQQQVQQISPQNYQDPNAYYQQNNFHDPYSDPNYPPQPQQRHSYVDRQSNQGYNQVGYSNQQDPVAPYGFQREPQSAPRGSKEALRTTIVSDKTERDSFYSANSNFQSYDNKTESPATIPTPGDHHKSIADDTVVLDEDAKRQSVGSQKIYPESIIETYATPSLHPAGDSENSSYMSPSKNTINNNSPHQNHRHSQHGALPKIPEPLSTSDAHYIPETTDVPDVPIPPPSPTRSPVRDLNPLALPNPSSARGSKTSLSMPSSHSSESVMSNDAYQRRLSPETRSYPSQASDERVSRDGYPHGSNQSLAVPNIPQKKASVQSFHSAHQEVQNHPATTPQRQKASPSGAAYGTPYRSPPASDSNTHLSYNNTQQSLKQAMYKSPQPSGSRFGSPSPGTNHMLSVPQSARPPRQTSPGAPSRGYRAQSASPRPPRSGQHYAGPHGAQQGYPPQDAYNGQQAYHPPHQQQPLFQQPYYPPPQQQQQQQPYYPPPQEQGYYPPQGYGAPPPQGYYPPPQQWYPPPQGYGYPPPQGAVPHKAPGGPKPPAAKTNGASEFAIGHLPQTGGVNKLHRTNKNDKKNLRNALTQGDFGI